MFTILEICEPLYEMDAYGYFRWRLNNWRLEFYELRNGLFQFQIDLPFIHITNTMFRKVEDRGEFAVPRYIVVQQVSGCIFGWKIKIQHNKINYTGGKQWKS